MKNLSLLFCVFILVLTSCSKDSASPVAEEQLTTNGTLLRKVITTVGTDVITDEYFYNGNKLLKVVSSNGRRYEYTYTGNLITKQDLFENNVLKSTENNQYNADQKITEKKILNYPNSKAFRCDYTYNTDGTVTVKEYSGDFTTQTTQTVNRKIFLFSNGDVEKIEEYVVVNGNPVTRINSYTYDTKNTPTNAILGYNKIKLWEVVGASGNSHNNTAIYFASTESNTTPYTVNPSYTYNSFNYPITADGVGATGQYFYQQP